MIRPSFVALTFGTAVLLSACASDPVIVNYTAEQSDASDWYVIPDDAPESVAISDPELSRPPVTDLSVPVSSDSKSDLSVVKQVDSLGNSTLKLNRRPGTAWELIDSALNELDINIRDRNRDEYQFELLLGAEKRSLLSFLKPRDSLKIVLIPQAENTLVAVEGDGDEVPDASRIEDILGQLYDHFQAAS